MLALASIIVLCYKRSLDKTGLLFTSSPEKLKPECRIDTNSSNQYFIVSLKQHNALLRGEQRNTEAAAYHLKH